MPQINRPRPSTSTHRSGAGPSSLSPPSYESPACLLNDAAQRALQNLQTQHDLKSLRNHLRHVNVTLSKTAADVNDLYQDRLKIAQRAKQRRAERGIEEEADQQPEEAVEIFRQQVEDQTAKMEETLRGSIDAQAMVEAREAALKEIHRNLVAGAGINAPTQSTLGASQFRKTQKRARKVNVDGDSEDDESGEEMQESEVVGPVELLQKKMGEFEVRYQALSLRNRYTSVNLFFTRYLLTSPS
jgi:hypothetical protein